VHGAAPIAIRGQGVAAERRHALRAAVAFLAVLAIPARADDGRPEDVTTPIRAFYAALLNVMQHAAELRVQGRYDKLAPAIGATFDLAAMTRIAVGPPWSSFTADTQAALVDGFTRMTIATYATRFDGYSGERFDVDPVVETRTAGRVVHTQLVKANGEPVVLNYLMRASAGRWRAVDVYLTGTISELATRRSEFSAILDAGGPAALVESLRQQTDKLLRAAPA
jgi:phospholipid transport system substrate-binding protein